jgi:hypothetical protein
MTYRTRIGILISFIVLFVITTPIIITYTAGYRWNTKKWRLEKVGIIFLRSRPAGADIYLNDKLLKDDTPSRLRGLLPDTYEIKVAKNGYTTWSKKLTVASALTTFAERIVLWKNTAPEAVATSENGVLTGEALEALNRKDQKTAVIGKTKYKTDGYEIWIENLENNSRETITRISEEIFAVAPYNDAGWVIYQTATAIHAIEQDGRDRRNDVILAEGNTMRGFAVTPDGKTLYYRAKENGVEILFSRQLQ